MTEVSDILNAIAIGEEVDWEFKSARGGLPGSMWETYSAMANTDGGHIVLGVKEQEDTCIIDKLENPTKLRKEIWDLLHNKNKVSLNLLKEDNVQIHSINGSPLILIRVPRADRRQRPVYIGQNPLLGTYRRNYQGDYRCMQDEVRRMMADSSDESADSKILEGFTFGDLDQESLASYRNRFSARSPDHAWLNEDSKGLLTKLGGWRLDRKTNQEGLTVAGLLMFGRMETIQNPQAVPQYHIDYRERLSDEPQVRWSDRLTLDGTWSGNLFLFYLRVLQKVSRDIKIPFQLTVPAMVRRDDTVVHEAIREALANAIIHADYRGQGGVVIEKFPDRIEISNPGCLLISRDQIRVGGLSECRNKSLQIMFQMIGFGEKAGSGMDKIHQGWKSQNWRAPALIEQLQPDRVKLIMPMISLISKESEEKFLEMFGPSWSQLSSEEQMTLAIADTETEVTNLRLQDFSSRHAADLSKVLKSLVKKGFLVSDGKKRWSRYQINENYNNIKYLEDSLGLFTNGQAPSQHQAGTKLAPSQFQAEELSKEQKIILEACLKNPRSLIELMTIIGRKDRSKFRSDFINPLLPVFLEMTIPEKPNSPQQKYQLTAQGIKLLKSAEQSFGGKNHD